MTQTEIDELKECISLLVQIHDTNDFILNNMEVLKRYIATIDLNGTVSAVLDKSGLQVVISRKKTI